MDVYELVLPETKPETEWVGGRALQKVSPQRVDPLAQAIELHDRMSIVTLGTDGRLEHPALPGFRLEIGPYFAAALGFSE